MERRIPFDRDGNRIRWVILRSVSIQVSHRILLYFLSCFPHIVNISCQTMLAELKKENLLDVEAPPLGTPPTDIANNPIKKAEWENDQLAKWEEYLNALESDLVGKCRSIVAACRVSGQRRQALLKKIDEGNKSGYWKGKLDNGKDKIPLVQLLRDCETRWSSTYNMIDRVLELYAVCSRFFCE